MKKPLWKVNQQIYHSMMPEFEDDASQFKTVHSNDIVKDALYYFCDEDADPNVAIYPAKSYVVALVFARMLMIHFDEDFYEVLNDPELLYNTDPHFVPYREFQDVYDTIIECLGGPEKIPLEGPLVDHTVKYFRDECLGEAECFKM